MDLSSVMWRKSSYSGGNCGEVAALPDDGRAVRDSKGQEGPVLVFAPDEWRGFNARVRGGEFDLA